MTCFKSYSHAAPSLSDFTKSAVGNPAGVLSDQLVTPRSLAVTLCLPRNMS